LENIIYFYTVTDKYGYLSNFAKLGFEADGKYWPTVEHYFQAKKFEGQPYEERIRLAFTPKEARNMGRSRDFPIRSEWEDVKVSVMKTALKRKFTHNVVTKDLLLSTKSNELIESSPFDYYWGCGGDGSGQNMLGKLLMELREELLK